MSCLSRNHIATLVATLMLVFSSPATALGQPDEQAVKATFIIKFIDYVEWPPSAFNSPSAPVQVCIAGADPFGSIIDHAASASHPDGRRVIVRHRVSTHSDIACNVMYIRASVDTQADEAVKFLAGKPVLTITDGRYSSDRGIIHFEQANGRVVFYINNRLAQRSGLKISSRLLALAVGGR
jgi:hypothetical protein